MNEPSPTSSAELRLPVIDIQALILQANSCQSIAAQIGQACRDMGFFYIAGHSVNEALQQRLETLSQQFFAQDIATKMDIRMSKGGRAFGWQLKQPDRKRQKEMT